MLPPDPSLNPDRPLSHENTPSPDTVDVREELSTGATGPYLSPPPTNAPDIPGYRILEEIAKGGMGQVYAAYDLNLDREVAIKTLLPGANAERFVVEAKITAKLPHPNIPPVHALGTLADGIPWLAMKRIRGRTLADLLKERSSPQEDLSRFLQIFEQIAQAVGFAHTHHIIHRDLKPLNVMVGEFGEVQVMDWGLAKVRESYQEAKPEASSQREISQVKDSSDLGVSTHDRDTTSFKNESDSSGHIDQTAAGTILGTPGYMAPEQARGEVVDTRADVFALGSILAVILTGKPAFVGTGKMDTIQQTAHANLVDVFARLEASGVDAELRTLAKRCLAAQARERPSDAREVAAEVAAYRAGVEAKLKQAETERAEAAVRIQETRKRQQVLLGAAALIGVVLLTGLSASLWQMLRANTAEKQALANAAEAKSNAIEAEREANAARKAETEATKQKQLAQEQANIARKAEANALNQKERAEDNLRKVEWSIYAGKLLLAQAAFNENNVPEAFRYLEECQWDLRGWEHAHLRWKFDSSKQTFHGHTHGLDSVAWSPDGKRILTGGGVLELPGEANVWDAQTGVVLFSLKGHTRGISSVAWSPDGKHLLTGSWDNTAIVWDAQTGLEVFRIKGHTKGVTGVAWSLDSKHILTGCWDGTATIWDAKSGNALRSLSEPNNGVTSVAWSPDGKSILNGYWNGTTKLWDAKKGNVLRTFKGHSDIVHHVTWSPDGKYIFTGSNDKTAKIWDAEKGNEVHTIQGHTDRVSSVAWSPDSKHILTGSWDNTAKVWDAKKGNEVRTFKGHTSWVSCAAWSPDGQRILTGSKDKTAKVWSLSNIHEILTLKGHTEGVTSAVWSPDGQRLLTGSFDKTAIVWDTNKKKQLLTIKDNREGLGSVLWSPDNKYLLTSSQDGTVKIWNARKGTEVFSINRDNRGLNSIALSPDGNRLVVGSLNDTMKIWDLQKQMLILTLQGNTRGVSSISWRPDGKRILGSSWIGTVSIWDAHTGREVLSLKQNKGAISSAAWSPDGQRFLTGHYDNTAKVWDAQTGRELLTLQGHNQAVSCVTWSPDGRRILTGSADSTIKIWDNEKGQELMSLKAGAGDVRSVAWSPDGQRILSGNSDGTATVWDSHRGQEFLILKGHTQPVKNLAWSPDGKTLFVWDENGKALAWDTTKGQPVPGDDLPTAPPAPGSIHSPDGRFLTQLEGNLIKLLDRRKPEPIGSPWSFPNANQRQEYHTAQAALAEKEEQWFAVAFHLGRLLLAAPDNTDLKKRREHALQKHAAPGKAN